MLKQICALFDGLFTVFKHLFKKPVTLEYPEKKKKLNDDFRGKPVVEDGCVACGMCEKVCPSGAIKIIKDNEGKYLSTNIDLKKCIFCGNCTFYCPRGAIKMSNEYELATTNIEDLNLVYKDKGDGND